MTANAIIEDNGTPKAADDLTLSPRAREIIERVKGTHAQWIAIAKWGRERLETKDVPNAKIGLAVVAYEDLRKKLTWPLWATTMSDDDIKAQQFSIQATYSRIQRIVPDVFGPQPVA